MTALVPNIPDRDRRRLVSAVGLLASDRDGEVVAAARAACRLLEPHGTNLSQLVEAALTPMPWRVSRAGSLRTVDHRTLARKCLAMSKHLSDWEAGFLESLVRWDGQLSPKQAAALDRIESKIDGRRSC